MSTNLLHLIYEQDTSPMACALSACGGQIWGFETLTSEQKREETDGDTRSSALYRKRGRVYPEAGCALDNLSL